MTYTFIYIYQPVIYDYYSAYDYYNGDYQQWNSSCIRSGLSETLKMYGHNCGCISQVSLFCNYSSWNASRAVSSACMGMSLLSYLNYSTQSQSYNNVLLLIINMGLVTLMCVALFYGYISNGVYKKYMVYIKTMIGNVVIVILMCDSDTVVMCLSIWYQVSVEPIDSELNVAV